MRGDYEYNHRFVLLREPLFTSMILVVLTDATGTEIWEEKKSQGDRHGCEKVILSPLMIPYARWLM